MEFYIWYKVTMILWVNLRHEEEEMDLSITHWRTTSSPDLQVPAPRGSDGCLIINIYCFTSRSSIFYLHVYRDVNITDEGLQNLGLCSALGAFEQGGVFIVSHLLWHEALVFPVTSEVLPHLRGCSMATSILHSQNLRFQITIYFEGNWDFLA
jgi:hypothetical protein